MNNATAMRIGLSLLALAFAAGIGNALALGALISTGSGGLGAPIALLVTVPEPGSLTLAMLAILRTTAARARTIPLKPSISIPLIRANRRSPAKLACQPLTRGR